MKSMMGLSVEDRFLMGSHLQKHCAVVSPIRAALKSFLDDSMPHSGNLKFSAEQGESASCANTRKQT